MKIDMLDENNKIIADWDFYKISRKKNKITLYNKLNEEVLILTFKNTQYAKECKKQITDAIKNKD